MVSYSQITVGRDGDIRVLILIVVEDGLVREPFSNVCLSTWGLNPYCSGRWSRTGSTSTSRYLKFVLILIVVEDGLVLLWELLLRLSAIRLNPYCSGRWSRTVMVIGIVCCLVLVLILIVVEDGLVHKLVELCSVPCYGLNPYCSGRWSRTAWTHRWWAAFTGLNPYCSGRWSRTLDNLMRENFEIIPS